MATSAPPRRPAQVPFAHGGEMGRRIAEYDWPTSPLGPVADWSPALRNTVGLMLAADVQMALFWGPEHVALYNDANIAALGSKHPHALGRPGHEHRAELWDDFAPLLRRVLAGETVSAKDHRFYVERRGFGEEVYFDISYSPVRETDGTIGGVLCIVAETTERVRAERLAAIEKDRLAQMFEKAPSFMAVLSGPDHVFELANPAYLALVGRDVIGLPVRRALPEIEGQGFFERLDEILRTGEPFAGHNAPIDLRAGRDGRPETRFVDFAYQPITDDGGNVTGIFVVGHDVTDKIRGRQELLLSEESLRLATDAGGIGKWDLDLVAGTLDWDARTKAVFGYPPDAACSMDEFYAGLHPDDRAATGAAFERAVDPARRDLYDVEYRTIGAADGVVRWVAARGRGVFDDDGRCIRAIGTVLDVTDRRARNDTLRESEARFRSLADSAPALIWITDNREGITFMNRWSSDMLGIEPQEMLGDGWMRVFPPDDLAVFRAGLPDAFRSGRAFSHDIRMRRSDGKILWVHCESRPRIFAGEHTGFVGVGIDVTEAHDAAQGLERAVAERTAELASANSALTGQIAERERVEATLTKMQRLEAVGQLTAGVAHDFNNLLTVVLGNLDLIERRGGAIDDERVRQRLRHMRTAAERGATLTAQLLAFSRRTRLTAKAVHLNDTVAGMRGLLGSTLGGSIGIETRLDPELWPALVDPTQIELAILNLAINARDAMAVGGALTIATGNVSRGPPGKPGEPPAGDHVVVSVGDDGAGMPADVLARAFEPFFTTKAVGKGSGLGLAQVYGFARQSGGGVAIDTVPGEGTTVHVYLPRAGRIADAVAAPDTMRAAVGAHGRRALVVDDDEHVRAVTADTLRDLGYEVVEADGGSAALELLDGIDVLIADFAMPGMNGAELAARAAVARPGLPVLIVTGFADLSAIAHLGEARIVQKPFQAGELERKLAALSER